MKSRVDCLLAAGLLTAPLLFVPGPVQAAPRAACTRLARDYNGDGHADIAAGAHYYNNGEGALAVAYGPAGTGPKQLFAGDAYGGGLTPGFFDGDCFADLAVGGHDQYEMFGDALAVGDFDGDKRPDLAVGVPESGDITGSVQVFKSAAGTRPSSVRTRPGCPARPRRPMSGAPRWPPVT